MAFDCAVYKADGAFTRSIIAQHPELVDRARMSSLARNTRHCWNRTVLVAANARILRMSREDPDPYIDFPEPDAEEHHRRRIRRVQAGRRPPSTRRQG